jgi:integrase
VNKASICEQVANKMTQDKRKYIGRVGDDPDHWIDAAIDFGGRGIYWDRQVAGLRIYIGAHKVTWQFFSQRRDHGERAHTFETLGRYDRGYQADSIAGGTFKALGGTRRKDQAPAVYRGPEPILKRAPWHMSVAAARDAATVKRAEAIKGTPAVNAQEGATFAQAFDGGYEISEKGKRVRIEGYLQYLERQAKEAGKPARWADKVRSLGKLYMTPKWGNYRMTELSEIPVRVAKWCREDIKSAVSANHVARIMRAMWRRAAKRDPRLILENFPTRAYEARKERGEQKGMTVEQFPAWFQAVQALPSPIHRAYHMVNLLTGARPGELARTTWDENSPDADTLTIGDAKSRNIAVPTTPEIRAELQIAADALPNHKPGDLIFPGCWNNPVKNGFNNLPCRGHALRRSYRTFAHSLEISDDIGDWLLGDAPEGVKAHYLLKWAMANNKAIVEAQHKISKAMMTALKAKPAKQKRAA